MKTRPRDLLAMLDALYSTRIFHMNHETIPRGLPAGHAAEWPLCHAAN
jgi:hypothetical protein